ncbi:MAG: hypothetical protein ACUVWB_01005 [Anaerolineae bacterium]
MQAQEYKVSKYRWVIVGVYTLAFGLMAIACFSVAPLVSSLSRDWGVSFSQANLIMGGAMNALMPIRMGLAQLQPGVRPWNAGILMGIVMTANGLGYFILPSISGMLVERSGPTSSALMLAGVTLVTLFLVVLFVKEPRVEAPAVPAAEPEAAS